jgi:two-component system OmpR family response regulator
MIQPDRPPVYCFDGWRLDTGRRALFSPNGQERALTGVEYEMLLIFCQHPQRQVSREQLHGWPTVMNDRSVDVRIFRLRQKVEVKPNMPQLIKTVRQVGYFFASPVEVE